MSHGRWRWIFALGLCASTVAAVLFAIYLSLDSGNYFFQRAEDRAEWSHDPVHVAFVCGLMLAEAAWAGGAVLVRWPRWLWARCALALLILLPWAVVACQVVLHMPAYVLFHHVWVLLLVAGLSIAALGSASGHLWSRRRSRA